jgi:protein-disulfide isomerase
VENTTKNVGIEMTKEKFSEISCPLCKKKLRDEKPKTLKQWKAPLIVHLIAAPPHHLEAEEAEDVVKKYFNRLSYFIKLQEERAKPRNSPA